MKHGKMNTRPKNAYSLIEWILAIVAGVISQVLGTLICKLLGL